MGVKIIKTTGSGNTIPEHHRSDKSSQENTIADIDNGDTILPRFIYSKLSNLADAKVIDKTVIMRESNEYAHFMMQMEEYNTTGENIDNIQLVDNYLGSLGRTAEYPFLKDTYSVPPWITVFTQDETRNVQDEQGLTTNNVVATIDGTVYNVVHRTVL